MPDARYVIIDDEYVVLDAQIPFFIWTNPYEGLTEEQANRAISIFVVIVIFVYINYTYNPVTLHDTPFFKTCI